MTRHAMTMGSALSQSEYVRCMQARIGFTLHGEVFNYMLGGGQLTPEMLRRCQLVGAGSSYILSYKGRAMEHPNDPPDRITPLKASEVFEWVHRCPAI